MFSAVVALSVPAGNIASTFRFIERVLPLAIEIQGVEHKHGCLGIDIANMVLYPAVGSILDPPVHGSFTPLFAKFTL